MDDIKFLTAVKNGDLETVKHSTYNEKLGKYCLRQSIILNHYEIFEFLIESCVDWSFTPEDYNDSHPTDCVCQSSLNRYNAIQLIYHQFYPDVRFLYKAITIEKPKTIENALDVFLQRDHQRGYEVLIENGYSPKDIWNCLKRNHRYIVLQELNLPFTKGKMIDGEKETFDALINQHWSLPLERRLRNLMLADNFDLQRKYFSYLGTTAQNTIKNLIRLGVKTSANDFSKVIDPGVAMVLMKLGLKPTVDVVKHSIRVNGDLYRIYRKIVDLPEDIIKENIESIDLESFEELWIAIE